MNIENKYEHKRGCGYRKPGGLYLVSGLAAEQCDKLPIPLTVCSCCGAGIKPARGWTWTGSELINEAPCRKKDCKGCVPFDGSVERFGLIWIGESFYKTPGQFIDEAATMGISRRIRHIPKNFVLGETWVLLAHRKACLNPVTTEYFPGIFTAFCPTAIEYVVKGNESEAELQSMVDRKITLIRVHEAEEQRQLI